MTQAINSQLSMMRAREKFCDLLEGSQSAIKLYAMPADANMNGDIFGGWVMSQIDLSGLVAVQNISGGRAATVVVNEVKFLAPIAIGDLVCCYTRVERIGTTSVTVRIEVITKHLDGRSPTHAASAEFVYVCIDAEGKKRPVFSAAQ